MKNLDYKLKALNLHRKLAGKTVITSKIPVCDKKTLSTIYTPGVGAVSSAIAKDKKQVWELTGRGNTVAIITDGTAVLGLGDIGPEAAMPVMEGKAVLFSQLGGVFAYSLCLNSPTPKEVVDVVRAVTPSVGGINLEDIAAPACFEVEKNLQDLEIPVFHDDQDGTAIVVLAALLNTTKILRKRMEDLKVVIMGVGAAGSATAWLLSGREKWQPKTKIQNLPFTPPKDLILVDSRGIIEKNRPGLNVWKKSLAKISNKHGRKGGIKEALPGADVFIGLSTGGKITGKMIGLMNKNPIIFAMANPVPEIMPDEAKKAGAALVATGRSDFPNQINNALVFPGFFRGLLDSKVSTVISKMKLAAALALSQSVKPTKNKILPNVLDKKAHKSLSQAVKKAAVKVKISNCMV